MMNALDIIAFAEKSPRWNFVVHLAGEYVRLEDVTATEQDIVTDVIFQASIDDDNFEFYKIKATVGDAKIIGIFYFKDSSSDTDTQRDQAVAFFKRHGFLSDVKFSNEELLDFRRTKMKTATHTINTASGLKKVRLDIFPCSFVEAVDAYNQNPKLWSRSQGGWRIEGFINDVPAGQVFCHGNLGDVYTGGETEDLARHFTGMAYRESIGLPA